MATSNGIVRKVHAPPCRHGVGFDLKTCSMHFLLFRADSRFMKVVVVLLAAAGLTGCKRAPRAAEESPAVVAARAAGMMPADARLAGLYRASCRNCHGHPESGAPPAGYHFAWDPRWAQGLAVLLSHTVAGYNGMPAGGQCFACTADDYKALIRFMAGRPGDAS
jgi:cytochrome c5